MKSLAECRLLLVDDAKANLDILIEGLKSDYKLSVAQDGETALQTAARLHPDLVLLDIVMPGIDGYEVCRRLRSDPATAEIPIVFLSSREDVASKTQGFEAGGNDYVTKPFNLLEVKARVNALLKAKAYNDAVKAQIASELKVAREIQMGMLPQDFGALERTYGIELAAVIEPARQVGGDLYGACAAGPERLVLFLGDVSDKGIPASLFMVRTIGLARLLARELAGPEQILSRLNDELATDNPSSMFVTLLCAVFEPASGRLAFASAGHCRPVVLPRHGPATCPPGDLGTVLGLEPGLTFERRELQLAAGDLVCLYTDGVTETLDAAGQCYGTPRLLAAASGLAGRSAKAFAADVLRDVRAFGGKAPQSDDLAMLVLRRPPPAGATLEFHATPDEVMRAVEALRQEGQKRAAPEKLLFGLSLALEEFASNVVNHAYGRDPARTFRMTVESSASGLFVELRDRGAPFDPLAAPERAAAAEPDQRPPGGWGLSLARQRVGVLRYTREGAENVLYFGGQWDSHRG